MKFDLTVNLESDEEVTIEGEASSLANIGGAVDAAIQGIERRGDVVTSVVITAVVPRRDTRVAA